MLFSDRLCQCLDIIHTRQVSQVAFDLPTTCKLRKLFFHFLQFCRITSVKQDMMTLREKYGSLDGLRVVIVGDIAHSRVARSNIWGLTKMGAKVQVCGPSTLTPREIEKMRVTWTWRVEEALEGADVVNILRIQKERQTANLLPSLREYALYFGVTPERLKKAKPNVVIMHPGPMNRGVEIAQDVAEDERNVILEQVTNGVATRMAVLYLLNGNEPAGKESDMAMVEA